VTDALPVDVICKIERRWQRRLDAWSLRAARNNKNHRTRQCPSCAAPAAVDSATFVPGDAIRYLCRDCGREWANEESE